jgi:nucleoside-diphosphate-sugar epimerase
VIGGTGLIGRSLVRTLAQQGGSVAVLARDVDAVSRLFGPERIGAFAGSVLEPDGLDGALRGCGTVVDLASAGSADSADLRRAIVQGARNVAERATRCRVRHLVHVSSIAALYLGRRDQVIRGETTIDRRLRRRADYARAKAEAEATVRAICREQDLALSILRPGLVVGEARAPFHSGVGEFNSETHCLGWNRGQNPLPFVLVDDVADAIARVVEAGPQTGRCFNLVGDVRLTAREYIQELGDALGRPLRYHPRPVPWLYGVEWVKWLAKRAVSRAAARPSYHDLKSRGLVARFDTSDVKLALGWQPEDNKADFIARVLAWHR